MARRCEICGKSTHSGNTVAVRGIPRYKGGYGLNITGRTKRKFKANIQKIRIQDGGSVRRAKVCTRCIRSGKVNKP